MTGLDKLDEPSSLIALRDQIDTLLPRIDLTDAILEIHGYTGFAEEFTHISQNNARVDNLALSICAVLAAEACNIGIEPLVDPEDPALTYARLAWVQQNYIRAETLTRAKRALWMPRPGFRLRRLSVEAKSLLPTDYALWCRCARSTPDPTAGISTMNVA